MILYNAPNNVIYAPHNTLLYIILEENNVT